MYDIMQVISSKPSSTSSKYTGPSYSRTTETCELVIDETILVELTQEEKVAIMNEPNQLWKEYFDGSIVKSVQIGSTEAVVDEYVSKVITTIAYALKLNIRLEQQSFINHKRADHWVIAFSDDSTRGRIVGCTEEKLPFTDYGDPFALEHNSFLVQIYDQMTEVYNYYGTIPTFAIGSTGREWRIFKLDQDSIGNEKNVKVNDIPSTNTKEKDHSPLTTNMGPVDYNYESDEMEIDTIDDIDGEIEIISKKKLIATKIYKWDDTELLYALGAALKQMHESCRTHSNDSSSLTNKVMWHLARIASAQPWGWATLKVNKLLWKKMIDDRTDSVVVLAMLGKGADGKVLLVANCKGQVAAMKLVKENATEEANNWLNIYSEYCTELNWNVRAEIWMGTHAVILPRLNQFITSEERLSSLDAVRKCLTLLFHQKGFIHTDIYWRNIGYFKKDGVLFVVMLDLHPTRVYKEDCDTKWIDEAIERLRSRASLSPGTDATI